MGFVGAQIDRFELVRDIGVSWQRPQVVAGLEYSETASVLESIDKTGVFHPPAKILHPQSISEFRFQ